MNVCVCGLVTVSPVFPSHSSRLSLSLYIYIYIFIKVKLATIVEGDQKAPFSIATTPR